MFWIVILCFAIAFMLIKLGALSVWVSVLSLVIKISLLVFAGVILYVLWRKIFAKRKVIEGNWHREE